MNDGSDPLRQLFKFDEADLYANRNGTLTQKQQDRVAKDEKSTQGGSRTLGIVLCVIAFGPIPVFWLTGALAFFGWFSLLWAIWPLIWGLLGVGLIWSSFAPYSYSLKQVEGPINIVKVEWRSGGKTHSTHIDYELHVGEEEFEVDSKLADYMLQGDTYSIYYVEDSDDERTIMSLEARPVAK